MSEETLTIDERLDILRERKRTFLAEHDRRVDEETERLWTRWITEAEAHFAPSDDAQSFLRRKK